MARGARPPRADNIVMEDARIVFRNFSGREGKFNQEGDRSFGVLLDDPKLVRQLEADGWNIKRLKPREEDEGEEGQPWLPVAISFKGRPCLVYMITVKDGKRRKNRLTEDMVDILDIADIITVDLIVHPYHYEARGQTGIKAYAQSLYATIEQDRLMEKYSDDEDVVPTRSGKVEE